ncbi:MAG: sulfonate transport system substrate-binding protein [Hyphomicrobiales bacterium]|jgi:NitT/TauT family transport system substrate-binding protein|nr:sulfonate transport system substrate-binding protein [Hyphomicrobiales bacterium]
MRKAFLAALVAAVSLILVADASAQQKLEKLTITSGGDGMHYFPVYIARGGGFFAKEGIEVDWVNVNSGTRQAASIAGGSADMTPMAFFHVIRARGEGADLVAVGDIFDVYGMTIVLSNAAIEKNGIKLDMPIDEKVKRLQGLKIGISSPGSSTDALIRSVLVARNYDPDKTVNLVPFGSGSSILAAFEKKLTDGVVYVAPVPETIEQKGLGKSVINPFQNEVPELLNVPFVIMATSRETLAKKPALVRRALRAMAAAMEFAHTHPDETAKIMRPYFPDLEDSIFKTVAETYRKASARSPVLTREQLDKTVAWMNIGAKEKVEAKFEEVVDDVLAKEAVASLKK